VTLRTTETEALWLPCCPSTPPHLPVPFPRCHFASSQLLPPLSHSGVSPLPHHAAAGPSQTRTHHGSHGCSVPLDQPPHLHHEPPRRLPSAPSPAPVRSACGLRAGRCGAAMTASRASSHTDSLQTPRGAAGRRRRHIANRLYWLGRPSLAR
jgi:hypothetical protein